MEACKEHIPETACGMSDPKAEVIAGDGVAYVRDAKEKFDVVIVDSTDPVSFATPLFGEEFYRNVSSLLSDDGVVVAQGESPFYEIKTQKSMLANLAKVFPNTYAYNFNTVAYPGGLWSFTMATKGLCPHGNFSDARVRMSGLEFQYYNSEVHKACFALPEFMRKELESSLSLLKPAGSYL